MSEWISVICILFYLFLIAFDEWQRFFFFCLFFRNFRMFVDAVGIEKIQDGVLSWNYEYFSQANYFRVCFLSVSKLVLFSAWILAYRFRAKRRKLIVSVIYGSNWEILVDFPFNRKNESTKIFLKIGRAPAKKAILFRFLIIFSSPPNSMCMRNITASEHRNGVFLHRKTWIA